MIIQRVSASTRTVSTTEFKDYLPEGFLRAI